MPVIDNNLIVGNWSVKEVQNLENVGNLKTVGDYTRNFEAEGFYEYALFAKEFEAAKRAVKAHPHFDSNLREEPRIGFDPQQIYAFFVFILASNGLTFVVTRHGVVEVTRYSLVKKGI